MTDYETQLAALGFHRVGMGGNVLGYRRDDGEIVEHLCVGEGWEATDGDDLLSLHTWSTLDTPEEDEFTTAPDYAAVPLRAILAALRNPQDEYSLLSLRLDAGYGDECCDDCRSHGPAAGCDCWTA